MEQQLPQIADSMTPRMTEALIFWGDRGPQGAAARTNLGKGGGTHGAVHRRGLIGQGRDTQGHVGYYLTPLGWALYTHLTGKPRPADPGRSTLDEALAEAYPADAGEVPAALRYFADYVTTLNGGQRVERIIVTREGQTEPVQVEELPYDPQRNAAHALEALGWAITGIEIYGGPSLFRAWVAPVRAAHTAPAPLTPADVARVDGVTVRPDGRRKWSVERDGDTLGIIWDEGPEMVRGCYATWSPYATAPGQVAGFFHDAERAVEAIVTTWPQSPASIARETGAPVDSIVTETEALAEDWAADGQRVYRTAIRGAAAMLTGEAAATIRQNMGLPAARYALAIGEDERTWSRFHSRAAALEQARSYGLTADAVRDTAPLLMPDQARGIVNQVHAAANDFRTAEDANGKFLGYTFRADTTETTRYGYITFARTFSMALEPTREDAAAMLPTVVLSDERHARRPDTATQRSAALADQRTRAAEATARYRAEMDDRTAAEARRHDAPVPPAVAARIAARTTEPEQPAPFKSGDRIVCADGRTRLALGMAPQIAGEPARVVVEGGAQWLAAECEPARETETAPARRVLVGTIVQHDGTTEGCVPADVEHPDVLAARRALAGLAAARLTDRHDVTEPTEEERQVRGYMVTPRGQGRVAIYWLEGGAIVRRDTLPHGAALDCLEDRMRREGWETERMGRSAQCLFAHVPDVQRQG